jgi:NAD(P)-dependent dehydrogenase (short-subunit alcohol dehydrogenase family)
MQIAGKDALVTGAATGIGRAAALALAAKGARSLILADIDAAGLAQTARDAEKHGTSVVSLTTDLSEPRNVEALFAEAQRQGPIRHPIAYPCSFPSI